MGDLEEFLEKKIRLEQNQQKKAVDEQKKAISQGIYPAFFSMPLSLQFELTGQCNLKCRHCYNRSGDLPADMMTVDRWKELSKEVVREGGIFECVISGGEPLLIGKDLFDIMDILHNDGTVFMLISNGFLMTQDIVSKLKKYRYRWVQISIDGSTAKIHDGLRQVEGSWEKAVHAALMIADAGIPLAIANTVMPATIEDLPEMTRFAFECGASSLITGEIFPSGRGSINGELLMNNAERGRLWQIIEEQRILYMNKMLIQRSTSNRVQLESVCDLPMAGAIIRPNGDIRLDCLAPFTIGNVATMSFCPQWKNKINSWQNEKVKKYIESVDLYSGKSRLHKNHVEGDIAL
jgi:MoaA/NifB/PqqE/SkfB family radical SAM enzyme